MDLDEARAFIRDHHHAVMATSRRDGGVQLSPVSVTVDSTGIAVVSTRETAAKVKNVRREPRASLCVLSDEFYGQFVQIEGDVTVVDLPDAMEGLVEYYRSISGEHPDWDDYRAAMVRDQRVLLRINITRAGPDFHG
jgi:PPOX class probable F420-dependent enzyme